MASTEQDVRESTDERRPLLDNESKTVKPHYNLVGLSQLSFWVLVCSSMLAVMLVLLDSTIIATLIGPISSDFRATNQSSWLGTSYLLSVCCVTPIYGRLCNIIGRRTSLLAATSIFALGNLLCAVAPSMEFLIAARCIAGLGGGGIQTIASTVMSDIAPVSHRGIMQGWMNVMGSLATASGPPLGGWLAESFGWRWAFWVQMPFFAIALAAAYFKVRYTVPGVSTVSQTPQEALKRVDFLGSLLLAAWLVSALVGVSIKANSTDDTIRWTSPTILILFGLALFFFVTFLFVELKYAKEPVLPVELLKQRTPVAAFVSNLTAAMAFFGILFLIPLFYTAVKQMTPSQAGAHLIPGSVVGAIVSMASGYNVRRTGAYYWPLFFSGLLGMLSYCLLTTWDIDTSEWMLWSTYPLATACNAGVTTLTVVALIAAVPREEIAMATSLSYVARTVGQVLGVALSGALVQAVLADELSTRIIGPNAKAIIASIRESSNSIRFLSPDLKAAAIASWQKGLHAVFVTCAGLTVIMIIAGLGVKELDLKSPVRVSQAPKPADEENQES